MDTLRIEPYQPHMLDACAQMLAHAFVSNPLNVSAFGKDVLAKNEAFFRMGLGIMHGSKLVANDDGRILGFTHWTPYPDCLPGPLDKLRMAPGMIRHWGLHSTLRVVTWFGAWAKHDPGTPHAHLGPIGVHPEAQGKGIGQRLMKAYCDELDRTGQTGYLETDRPENVPFYSRFGFHTTHELPVIGVPNFFMKREPQTAGE